MNPYSISFKSASRFLTTVLGGALLFNAIFWQEKLGLNLLLFVAFSCVALFALYRNVFAKKQTIVLLIPTILSMVAVVVYNSVVSCVACFTMLLLLTAYCKYSHRSPVYAAASAAESFLFFVPRFFVYLKQYLSTIKTGKSLFGKLRLTIVPAALLLVFFLIYMQSSKVFSEVVTMFSEHVLGWIWPIVNWLAPERIAFTLLGLCISGGLLYRSCQKKFEEQELHQNNDLVRVRHKAKKQAGLWQEIMQLLIGRSAVGPLGLLYEYKAGILSFIVLNLLLLFVNVTDIVFLWAGRNYNADFAWSEYVHEGAELLIVSIILAMLVVLFFFRGNLNFFKQKSWLLTLAYIWIIQNVFLTASVALRNYHYVVHMGLTYKRIGVFVFALLVAAGLASVFLKIHKVKSIYYLIKVNAGVALVTLVLSTFFQWDVLIARYNIAHRNSILLDTSFLLRLSDHALPVLQQHAYLFSNNKMLTRQEYMVENNSGSDVTILSYRINTFLQQQKSYTWLSWNIADQQTKKALERSAALAQR